MWFEVDGRRVVYETIDGELILIDMDTGFYYSLEGAGLEIWDGLVAGRAPGEIAERLRARYEAPADAIEDAVSALVDQLQKEGLLEEACGPRPPGPAAATPRSANGAASVRQAFDAPELRRYTDMADFMLVDPIHEVDETGWPNRKVAP